jgi:ribosomal protein S18 acetylase RimI-like enzyme
MEIQIHQGLPKDCRKDAATLYASAFEGKFVRILGEKAAIVRLFEASLHPERAICALDEKGQFLGLAGYHKAKHGFIDLRFRHLRKQYGFFSGLLRFAMIAVLYHRSPDHSRQLLMDGIAVREGYRGQGIVKKLFSALLQMAEEQQMESIKLDVIDENPKAKKLYASLGFELVKYEKVPGFIQKRIGVSGVSAMVLHLHPDP